MRWPWIRASRIAELEELLEAETDRANLAELHADQSLDHARRMVDQRDRASARRFKTIRRYDALYQAVFALTDEHSQRVVLGVETLGDCFQVPDWEMAALRRKVEACRDS